MQAVLDLMLAAAVWVFAADVARLGADDFRVREAAHANLYRHGWLALPAVQAARESADPEVRFRADGLARGLTRGWIDAPRGWWLAAAAICGPDCPFYFESKADEHGVWYPVVNPGAEAVGRAWWDGGRGWDEFEAAARFMGVLRWDESPGWRRFGVIVHQDENFIWELRSCQVCLRNWHTHQGRR